MEAIKKRITDYWSRRVEGFSALRRREFAGEKGHLWNEELNRYLPAGRALRILDAGTGTGFLAFLLAAQGHRVTGIDLTPGMIAEAKQTAARLRLPADFFVMDAEEPDFADQSFDVIVSRNLTWTLPHLERAYCRWHTLLKPGGILLNFDADYCHEKPLTELPRCHAHQTLSKGLMTEYEHMKDCLRPAQRLRPQWDVTLLEHAGFHAIAVDGGIWQRIYHDVDEFFNPTPIFTISAMA